MNLPNDWQLHIEALFWSLHAFRALRSRRLDVLDALALFRPRQATNPRDKIYGLLGLSSELANIVSVDYAMPTEQIYERLLVSHLTSSRTLDILSHARPDSKQRSALPSFVPDWSFDLSTLGPVKRTNFIIRCLTLHIYKAAAATAVNFEAQPGRLFIHGKIVDQVELVAMLTLDDTHHSRGLSPSMGELLDEALQMASIPPRSEDQGLLLRTKFWVTLTADRLSRAGPLPIPTDNTNDRIDAADDHIRMTHVEPELYESYEMIIRELWSEDYYTEMFKKLTSKALRSFDDAVGSAQTGRRFTITREKRMGLCQKDARKGDVVAVLTGGSVPFILRPNGGHYTLVGDAYIQGFMDGEAMPGLKDLEIIELR